jgi:hypothetical protein
MASKLIAFPFFLDMGSSLVRGGKLKVVVSAACHWLLITSGHWFLAARHRWSSSCCEVILDIRYSMKT